MKKVVLSATGALAVAALGYFGYTNFVAPPQVELCTWVITYNPVESIYVSQDDRQACLNPDVIVVMPDPNRKEPVCAWEVILSKQDKYKLNPKEDFDTLSSCPTPAVSCTGDGC